jgi:hypothetical protein
MLTVRQVAEVRRLLLAGRSQREVHRLTHMARDAIAGIAHDRRPDYEAIRQAKREELRTRTTGPKTRCPGCGHLVHFPCHVCRTRRWQFLSLPWDRSGPLPELEEPLGLELAPQHQRRYEQVRARRAFLSRPENSRTDSFDAGDGTA